MTHDDDGRIILSGDLHDTFARYSGKWSAESILRGKNIGLDLGGERQLDFCDLGLIPALEGQSGKSWIGCSTKCSRRPSGSTGRMRALTLAKRRGRSGWPSGFLAAKVLHDRGFGEFAELSGSSDPAEVLSRVESYYGQSESVLDDRAVWNAVFPILWSRLNFQNLAVEVLRISTSTRS